MLLSSHILSEVERLCDRVSIIREGRNVESGTLAQLRHLSRTTVHATLAQPIDAAPISRVTGVADVLVSGDHVTCTVGSDNLGRLLEVLGTRGITALTSAPPTLEELFMDQYRHDPHEPDEPDDPDEPGGDGMTTVAVARPVRGGGLTGTTSLLRLATRRDRVLDPGQRGRASPASSRSPPRRPSSSSPTWGQRRPRWPRRWRTRRSSPCTARSRASASTRSRRSSRCSSGRSSSPCSPTSSSGATRVPRRRPVGSSCSEQASSAAGQRWLPPWCSAHPRCCSPSASRSCGPSPSASTPPARWPSASRGSSWACHGWESPRSPPS